MSFMAVSRRQPIRRRCFARLARPPLADQYATLSPAVGSTRTTLWHVITHGGTEVVLDLTIGAATASGRGSGRTGRIGVRNSSSWRSDDRQPGSSPHASRERAEKLVAMRAPTSDAAELAELGFDVLSIAMNHAMDYGVDGTRDTANAPNAAGVLHAGFGESIAEATVREGCPSVWPPWPSSASAAPFHWDTTPLLTGRASARFVCARVSSSTAASWTRPPVRRPLCTPSPMSRMYERPRS
ncbi:MAG: hypothetical protein EOP24_44215 [Hyphomicrobiales bacterium]|nr:MAG: hypothetical protein EOP24_44215 [Hyphomicrobiales bacterium]